MRQILVDYAPERRAGKRAWPVRPPRILNTVQPRHDKVGKTYVLTDGARLYITETTGAKSFLVHMSLRSLRGCSVNQRSR